MSPYSYLVYDNLDSIVGVNSTSSDSNQVCIITSWMREIMRYTNRIFSSKKLQSLETWSFFLITLFWIIQCKKIRLEVYLVSIPEPCTWPPAPVKNWVWTFRNKRNENQKSIVARPTYLCLIHKALSCVCNLSSSYTIII